MKFTHHWLQTHIDTALSPKAVQEKLTSIGLEVESVEEIFADLAPLVIAELVEVALHPGSKKLSLCQVDAGDGKTRQIVCGAPNVYKGMRSVLAPIGAYIPSKDLHIKETLFIGEASQGMLCSEDELGLGSDADGIIDLPADAPLGACYVEWSGVRDHVFDMKATPNRADALSVYGVARDLAAADGGTLRPLDPPAVPGSYTSPISWTLDQKKLPDGSRQSCFYVAGRHFKGVRNRPSPPWLQQRLRSIGLRPISALVDITNFVTFDLGRPLHVFDAQKLAGPTLTMRFAGQKESLEALDGQTYALAPDMTVIADASGPVSLAGIMGGEQSGCTLDTQEVFLEVALFDPIAVAATGRILNLQSDARYRFERGLDPQSAIWGLDVAARLILDLCGGETSYPVTAGTLPDRQSPISLDLHRLESHGGARVAPDQAQEILTGLGFEVTRDGDTHFSVIPPTYRVDIVSDACLIEEILRIHGYDNIQPVSLPPQKQTGQEESMAGPRPDPARQQRMQATRLLAGRGMLETVTWSFLSAQDAERFGGGQQNLRVHNPISSELVQMRPSILPNLLQAIGRNAARGYLDGALFEAGPVYHDEASDKQAIEISGVRSGLQGVGRHWSHKAEEVSWETAKADVLAVITELGLPLAELRTSSQGPDWYHPGQSGSILFQDQTLARFGVIHPSILKQHDIRRATVGFEVFLDVLYQTTAKLAGTEGSTRPPLTLLNLQPVRRDLAFVADQDVLAESLIHTVREAGGSLLTHVHLFDVYRGEELQGKKSLALEITLQPVARSLTDQELAEITQNIAAAVKKAHNAELRSS